MLTKVCQNVSVSIDKMLNFCQKLDMSSEDIETDKKKAIASAAFQVFAEHGFRKTSMQLIAAQAKMSRPALYLHFQSKEDVFGFLVLTYFEKVEARAQLALTPAKPPEQALADLFDAFDPDGVKAVLLDAKHGDEMIEVNNASIQSDVQNVEANILRHLQQWLSQEAQEKRIICTSPDASAQTILSSYYGLKSPPPTYADYKARTAELAKLIGKGLKP